MDNRVLHRVFLRSLFLQGTWNFERMQNLGFCYSMFPVLSEVHGEGEEMKDAVKRHLEFFNTHPYMASLIIGTVVRLEEEVGKGVVDKEDVNSFKTGVMGSCGAIGDSLFWGAIKPFAAVAGVCLAAVNLIVSPIFFLVLYNVPHLWMRIFGIYRGYRNGADVFSAIRGINFTGMMARLRFMTVILSGLLLALLAYRQPVGLYPEWIPARGAISAVLCVCLYLAVRKGMSTQLLIYLSLLSTVAISVVI